jgi:tetratricopeptide repeat protein 8
MADPTHAPAYNNLGVMEARSGRTNVAQSLFQASAGLAHVLFEPHYNYALLANEVESDLFCSRKKFKNQKFLFRLASYTRAM